MPDRLRRWFAKPGPDAKPSDNLRWVRRLAVALAALAALSALRQLVTGDGLWWIMLAGSALLLISALLLTVTASSVDRNPPRQDGSG